MPDLTKQEAGKEAAQAELKKLGKPKRKYARKAKRGPGRPKKSDEVTPRNLVGAEKRKPGRPKGSKSKRGPGRPKGPGKKKKRAGRLKAAAISLKGYVKQREARRIAKEAVKAFKAKLPGLITKELKRQLR